MPLKFTNSNRYAVLRVFALFAFSMSWCPTVTLAQGVVGSSTTNPQSAQNAHTPPADLIHFNADSGFFEFADHSLKIGGYVKADAIVDLDRVGDTDRFDTRTIETDGTDGNNFRLHARQTRLNLDYRYGDLRAFVEVDFFGSGSTVRLRHAYGQWNGFTFGQTWSTFVDPDVLPDLLDFEAPTGALTTRRALIRYQRELGEFWEVSASVEDPGQFNISTPGIAGRVESLLPDFVAETKYQKDFVRFRLAGFATATRWRPDAGSIQDELLWGVSGTGRIQVSDNDRLKFEVSYGDGLQKFRGVTPVGFNQNGDFEASSALAWMVALEHDWTEQFSSTVAYSQRDRDVSFSESDDAIQRNQYLATNLLFRPSKNTTYGIEYLWGTRENNDNAQGEAHRIMMSAKYKF